MNSFPRDFGMYFTHLNVDVRHIRTCIKVFIQMPIELRPGREIKLVKLLVHA